MRTEVASCAGAIPNRSAVTSTIQTDKTERGALEKTPAQAERKARACIAKKVETRRAWR